MTAGKRAFDLFFAVILSCLLLIPIVCIAALILLKDGRPIFYPSKRMKTSTQSFTLWKFRTMIPKAQDASVSAAYKNERITPLGHALRKRRLDELPQLWNVLTGDMSFVGPRPPLRRFVKMRPDLYTEVLRRRPGITGLATLLYHSTEEHILSGCHSKDETDDTYLRRCVPAKAKIDLIWARNWSLCFDLVIIWRTLARIFTHKT